MVSRQRQLGWRGWVMRGLASILILGLLGLSGGVIWLLTPQSLLPEAAAATVSDEIVAVTVSDSEIAFNPAAPVSKVGLIIYPGAKVPAVGYAPLARMIASRGYATYLVSMPGNLALLAVDRAQAVQSAHPEIATWVVAGHSLGGVAAAQFASRNPASVQGLVLWASYPIDDLSSRDLAVLSIWGELDRSRANFDSAETRASLPADTEFIEIPGGNHEQFGYYTGQANDPIATVSRAEQQETIAEATIALLESLSVP